MSRFIEPDLTKDGIDRRGERILDRPRVAFACGQNRATNTDREFTDDGDIGVRCGSDHEAMALFDVIPRRDGGAKNASENMSEVVPDEMWKQTPEEMLDEMFERMPDELWDWPEHMAPSEPEGPGARPGARLDPDAKGEADALVRQWLARFTTYLRAEDFSWITGITARGITGAVDPFVRYLVCEEAIPPEAVNEVDLRLFLYYWYPRNIRSHTAARALLLCLERFFEFLEVVEHVRCPWAHDILRNEDVFYARFRQNPWDLSSHDAERLDEQLRYDLSHRLLLPLFESGMDWSRPYGPVQEALLRDLKRSCLAWRDAMIRSGITRDVDLRSGLVERHRVWNRTPHPIAGGETPMHAIARERNPERDTTRWQWW
jgi:hypothetical protein